jgi:hypothetical protein
VSEYLIIPYEYIFQLTALQGIVAVQNAIPVSQTSIGVGLLIFSQTFAGAISLSLAQTVFSSGLRKALPVSAPSVDIEAVIHAGAAGISQVASGASIDGVRLAYSEAINHVYYLGAGACVGWFIFSWGMGWKSVKKAKVVVPEA